MISKIIKNRQSIYPSQYNNSPILKETVQKIIEVANYAPTHRKTQPWRFKVLHSAKSRIDLGTFLSEKYKETTSTFSEFKYKRIQEKTTKAGCIIVICMQRDKRESIPEWEEIAATAMAVQNMWLVCSEMGVGCYWSSPGQIKFINEFIKLNAGEKCLGLLYMGNYDESPVAWQRTPIEEKTQWF